MEHRKSMQWTISMASGEFRVRQKKTQKANHKIPVQPLLNRHGNHHPPNGRGITIFWTASTATAAATDTTTATQPMEEALAIATATHPMEEPLHKMKIMRLRINESIWFEFLSRKRLWFDFFVEKETFRQTKLSCKKYVKGHQKWWETERKQMAIDQKMGGDGQECIGK
jgi:hypothetical protein